MKKWWILASICSVVWIVDGALTLKYRDNPHFIEANPVIDFVGIEDYTVWPIKITSITLFVLLLFNKNNYGKIVAIVWLILCCIVIFHWSFFFCYVN